MKRVLLAATGGMFALIVTGSAVLGDEVVSLRGGNPIDELSKRFDPRHNQKTTSGFKRSWKLAPPMIPHSDKAFKVTLGMNVCAYCHAKDYKWMEAPKAGDSHFIKDASGNVTTTLDSRRYFCRQCHAPQAAREPIVSNNF